MLTCPMIHPGIEPRPMEEVDGPGEWSCVYCGRRVYEVEGELVGQRMAVLVPDLTRGEITGWVVSQVERGSDLMDLKQMTGRDYKQLWYQWRKKRGLTGNNWRPNRFMLSGEE